jgi:5'-nucleotidase/5'-nucleotidase/UDP-sugar diphosphatase
MANFINDAIVTRCRAAGYTVDLAAVDASCVYGGLPVGGELTFGDWFDLMPYADTIRICQMTIQQLEVLLDDNARRADRVGEPHTERGFLQFSKELRYRIELGESRSQARATDIELDGIPLEAQMDRTVWMACTSFCRETARPWERHAVRVFCMPVVDVPEGSHVETDLLVRDEMIAHICEHGGVTVEAGARRDGRLTFAAR